MTHGIPAIVGRWQEQSSKGIRWKYIGPGGWLFAFDNKAEVTKYVPAVSAMAKDTEAAKIKKAKAEKLVSARLAETIKVVELASRQLSARRNK